MRKGFRRLRRKMGNLEKEDKTNGRKAGVNRRAQYIEPGILRSAGSE